MKNYTITVNGAVYDVTVEETTGVRAAAPVAVAPAPVAVPVAVPQPVVPAPSQAAPAPVSAPSGAQGTVKVNAPMPGKIIALKSEVGKSIKKGEVVLILEAMKMENEIVAPQDGTVASIDVAVGNMVEAGTVLATLN